MTTNNILPLPFDWCSILAGKVTLEDNGTYNVAAFDMAKYPITNAQFQTFAKASDGYANTAWWDYSPMARRWRAQNDLWETGFPGDDLPRTCVSWYEAAAFCRWLSAKTGENILLPSELEWQRAAQGDDGRKYPWGNTFEIDRCNTSESGIKVATSVTKYLDGASPYGVMDLSGNIAEWCVNGSYTPGEDDVASFAGGEARAMRGGSYGLSQFSALAVFRGFNFPADRYDFLGFRIVRHP
jgi:formylglycine-generating enzyme required for sulfatase activity